MAPESESDLRLEIGHVLFLDLVGYSKLLIEEQKERLGQLTEIVLATAQVREAPDEQLIRLPTGDGMALVFQNSSEEPARCALEAAKALKAHPEIAVRMGIHSGPVSRMVDVSGKANVAGAGINMAQRVMDCGDAGHSLVSRRALELDDSLAEAHTALAMLHYAVDYDWGASERGFQRAIRLNPNCAAAHWQYGWLLVYVGRFDEAVREMQRAVELDPLSAVMTVDLAAPYMAKRDYDEAIAQCRRALALDPSFFLAHFVLGAIEVHRGASYSKAIEEFQLVQAIETQPLASGFLGFAYARLGQRDKAIETLNELNQLASRRFVSPYHRALVHLGLGENSRAIDWLEKAYEARSPWLTWLKVEPMFDPLRSDPRFRALYRKMNFPP